MVLIRSLLYGSDEFLVNAVSWWSAFWIYSCHLHLVVHLLFFCPVSSAWLTFHAGEQCTLSLSSSIRFTGVAGILFCGVGNCMGFMPGIAVHPHAVVTTRLFSAVCRRKRRGQGLGGISVSGVL